MKRAFICVTVLLFTIVGLLMLQTWPAQAQVWTPTPRPAPGPPGAIEADVARQVTVLGRLAPVSMLQIEGLASITGLTHPFSNLAFPSASYYMTGCDSVFMWNPPSATYMWTGNSAIDVNQSRLYFSRHSRWNARFTGASSSFNRSDINTITFSGFTIHNDVAGSVPVIMNLFGRSLVLERRDALNLQLRWSGPERYTQPGTGSNRYMSLQGPAKYDITITRHYDPTQSTGNTVRLIVTAVSRTSGIANPTWSGNDVGYGQGFVYPTWVEIDIGNYHPGDDSTQYTGNAIWSVDSIIVQNQQPGGTYTVNATITNDQLQPPQLCNNSNDLRSRYPNDAAWTQNATSALGSNLQYDVILSPTVKQNEFICNSGFDKSPLIQDYALVPRCPFTDIPIVALQNSGLGGGWASETFGQLVGTDGAAAITAEALMWLIWTTLTMTGYYVGFILSRWLLLAVAGAMIAGMIAIAMTPLAPLYILFLILGALASGLTITGSIGRQI